MRIVLAIALISSIATAHAADGREYIYTPTSEAAEDIYEVDPEDLEQPLPELGPHYGFIGTVGLATPVGVAGLELEVRPTRWISFGAGFGMGLTGPQFATMGRFGVPLGRIVTVRFGLGASAGPYKWFEQLVNLCLSRSVTCPDDTKTWDIAYWGNGELGVELRLKERLIGRPFVGFSHILNPRGCDDCNDSNDQRGRWLIYTGFSLIRAF